MDEAADAERILVMDRGRLVLQGRPDEVFSQEEHLRAVGLTQPPARAISRGLIRRGLVLEPALTADDLVKALLVRQEAPHG
jgi:ABC-type glutathione transport system ATPase component